MDRYGENDNSSGVGRIALRVIAGALVITIIGGIVYISRNMDSTPPSKQDQPEFQVTLTPPPPPPPPQEVKPPPPEDMQKIDPVKAEELIPEEELKDLETPPEDVANTDEPPPGPLGLDAAPSGPGDQFNLAGKPGGRGLLSGGGGSTGSFPGQLAAAAQRALTENAKTKIMQARIPVRLWLDATGRAIRVELDGSTGDAALDAAIRSVLLAASYRSPPADIRMPVVTRVTARRPA